MTDVKTPSGLNVLAGIWLLISPWVLAFNGLGNATSNNVILGIVIGVLAACRATGALPAWASWVNLILGLWVIISPWALGFSSNGTATSNDVIFGIIVAVLAVWSANAAPVVGRGGPTFAGTEPERRERGEDPWR